MPAKANRIPSYRKHRPSGQAVVTLNGRDCYLGPWGTEASKHEYDRVIAEWAANGRRLPSEGGAVPAPTVNDLILAHWGFVETHYRRAGVPTSEQDCIRSALGFARRLYGRRHASEFGPLALRACRKAMIDRGLSRGVINDHVGRIRRMFRWATEHELVPPEVFHGLQAVAGLKRGRSEARETEPVRPVPEEHIKVVPPLVSSQVRAMIELQLLTGMRPGEVRIMRGCNLDMTGRVWTYTPDSHKTEHHGIERLIYLGPKAQKVIKPFLKTDLNAFLFSPRDAEAERNRERRKNRKTPMTPSQSRRKPKAKPKRTPKDHYTKDAYRRAIVRACEKAGVPSWHPHRLRHNAATRLRKLYGLEATQSILGHRTADVTQLYAERDHTKAREIMEKIG